jgi:hypothetical protein
MPNGAAVTPANEGSAGLSDDSAPDSAAVLA